MNMDNQLDRELLELEAQLASLVPSAMPTELASSVSAQVDHSIIDASVNVHDSELKDLEAHLELLSPTGLTTDVLSRMNNAMDRWHEYVPVEEKVVPFGQSEPTQEAVHSSQATKQSNSRMYAAAAAVALLGAAAALVIPNLNQNTGSGSGLASGGNTAEPSSNGIATYPAPEIGAVDVLSENNEAWIVPNSLSHKVTHTSDAGVLMSRDNIPHRRIRIDYVDQVKILRLDGREIEIDRPGVQYMLIPVETN